MMSETLDCKTAENDITAYFNDTLRDEDTLKLFDHLNECPSCMEEFTIQHLVSMSLNDADDDDMDTKNEIALRRKEILRRLSVKDVAQRFYLGIVFFGVTIFFMAALTVAFY